MMTLTYLFVLFLWYAFGWVGSVLLLLTVLYSVNVIYHTDRINETINKKLRKIVLLLYVYFGFDWTKDELQDLRLSFPVICIMAVIAIFGTYAITFAFVLSIITFITLQFWQVLQNR